jgi:hypothetical protein
MYIEGIWIEGEKTSNKEIKMKTPNWLNIMLFIYAAWSLLWIDLK